MEREQKAGHYLRCDPFYLLLAHVCPLRKGHLAARKRAIEICDIVPALAVPALYLDARLVLAHLEHGFVSGRYTVLPDFAGLVKYV
jgi:hypothetical protein